MPISPRIVTEDLEFEWDGATQRLTRGTVLDVQPGSALEEAIGAQRLVPAGTPAASAEAPAGEAPAPRRARAAKAADESGDSGSEEAGDGKGGDG